MVNPALHRSFEKLQNDTKLLLKEVSPLSSTTYHYRPAEGKWSISQILTHLLTSERLSLSYMKKKSLGVDQLENAGIIDHIKFLILKLSQRVPFRYKAPRQVIEQTPAPLSYGDLVRQWEIVRQELYQFLSEIPENNVRKKIYKHPRVGMLDVSHAIQFLGEHLQHHRPQIMAIIHEQKKRKLEKH
jgi:uncharacterized damage-inducible protein DinB